MTVDPVAVMARFDGDRSRLLDMLWEVQDACGYIPDDAVAALGAGLSLSPVEVRATASYYHFFHDRPAGRHQIYLADTVIARMNEYDAVLATLEEQTGARLGGVDPTGEFGLYSTPCVGLSDQEPAMLVDKVAFTRLRPGRVADLIGELRAGASAEELANPAGLDRGELGYVEALVESNVRTAGPVFFVRGPDYRSMVRECFMQAPEQVTELITDAGMRGRGGAGFHTGLKWQLCTAAPGERKYVICNADEGEPGTFKDRVLLTRSPKQVFVGMVICAYAIGSSSGIVYLRAEYWYLKDYLEAQLDEMRTEGLLGRDIGGRRGFHFDIRIQMGAGAYVCGEESALIESCEGRRGSPRVKPPFPAQSGYHGQPTCIDNVESFACIARIVERGADWFAAMGTDESTGTRLVSVAGDCSRPGVYEVEWGTTLQQLMGRVGGLSARAVQVSGPSGECVDVAAEGQRLLSYEDLSCNGAITVFGPHRDILGIVRSYIDFFIGESCGICVPCRVGNVALRDTLDRVISGRASEKDLDDLVAWGSMIRAMSRCGLGGTSPKPILTTLEKFPELYRGRLATPRGPLLASFDLAAALGEPTTTDGG
jgi:[NiFe] hydrogenase diaphorase moiety large subunit